MAILTINANDVSGATSIQVRYRVLNSGLSYTILTLSPSQLPYAITGLQSAQYEVGVRKLCSNGAYSPWVDSSSAACAAVVTFGVVKTGSNFVVTATLAGSQTFIDVQMTDPNGGVSNFTQNLGGQSGTFNIAVPSGLPGTYTFIARGVCDNVSTPRYVSAYTAPVTVIVT